LCGSAIRDTTPGKGARIPVVDAEGSIVDAVATALRYEGFEVEEAGTGRDALAAVARFDPDLIVLDWMLPDIEGIEVGRRLRERGHKNAILFLTAKDAVENKVEALRAGGDDWRSCGERRASSRATCCATRISRWTRRAMRSSAARPSSSSRRRSSPFSASSC
jgi:CheY-like chemotaxis protein